MPGFDFEMITDRPSKFGLIVLKSDETIENEFRRAMPAACELFHSRIPSQPDVTPETLMQMKADLPLAAASIPAEFGLEVIGYACTSGATVIGPGEIERMISAEHPGVAVTNPVSAVAAALRHLQARQIGFVTPYIEPVSQAIRDFLTKEGFSVANLISFEQQQEEVVARISERSVLEAVIEAARDEVDAVFVSCTNLKSFEIIEEAEAAIGRPVISSNLALAWHMLALAGADHQAAHLPGRLCRPDQ